MLDLHDPEIRREQLLAYYSELLNSLKSLGAVLNFVKPEFLLSAEDFHAWWKSGIRKSLAEGKLTAAELQKEEYYTRMDMYFKYVSTESWAHLIMQAAKLFVFDRISPKQVKNTSGFQLKEDDQLLSGIAKSSVYSVPESLLLHWATMGYHRSTGVWRPVKNFEKDLADGSVIYHIIKAYIGDGQMPQCTKLLNFNGDKHSDSETNTKILMQALSEIFASQTSDPLPVYSNERVGQIDFSRVKLGDLYGKHYTMFNNIIVTHRNHRYGISVMFPLSNTASVPSKVQN